MLSWLWDNIGSLVLALVLAVTVWVAAVSAEDPIEVREHATPIPIEQVGLKPGLIIVNQPADQATVHIRAPRSILSQLRPNEINLWIDMQDLDVGMHTIPVQSRVDRPAVQINAVDPSSQIVTLESAASTQVPIVALASGEPAVGFRASPPDVNPEAAVVTGPASAVTRTDRIIAEIDLNGRRQDFSQEVNLIPVDEEL